MKRRIYSILLATALFLALAAPAAAAGDGDRGVIKYEEVIAPQYEDARTFSNGLAAVKLNGKWGYIDLDNKVVIDFLYDDAKMFSEGYAVVGKLGSMTNWDGEQAEAMFWGFIDETGSYKPFRAAAYNYETKIDEMMDYYQFTDNLDANRSYCFYGGYVRLGSVFDTSGNMLEIKSEDVYASAHVPTEGLVPLYGPGGFTGYADANGTVVKDFIDHWKYYDADWNQVPGWEGAKYQTNISNVRPFNQGLAIVWQCTTELETWEESYKFGFMDRNWNWVIEPQFNGFYWSGYDAQQIFTSDGLACVSKDEVFGAVDRNNRVVIPFQYDELWAFTEGLSAFLANGLYGYLDTTGNTVIPARYQLASGFHNGLAAVYDGSKAFLINRNGDPVAGSELLDPDNYFIEYANGARVTYAPEDYVTIKDGGKYGFGRISYLQPLPDPSEMASWAYEEVVASIEHELVPGYMQNLYRSNVTRGDYADLVLQAVCTILDTDPETLIMERKGRSLTSFVREYPFTDTASSSVLSVYALGIVNGYEDGTFRPYNKITRQEAAVLLTNTARLLGFDTESPDAVDFTDKGQIATWAADGVNFVFSVNVMTGTEPSVFSPLMDYTRQQAFITVYRLLLAMAD